MPEQKFLTNLDVAGTVDLSNLTIDSAQGTDGQVLTSTGTGIAWEDTQGGASETAERIEVTVKNISGGSLSKGTVVHTAPSANPPNGNVIEVIAADYDDITKMPAIGILNETIANEGEGSAVMMGAVSGIDTSSFSIGDELYVGNLGTLTNSKPTTAGQLIQKIAVVIKSHASNGLIKIFGAGRSNDVPLPLYIDNANQRVGIGDSTPSYTLDVNGTIYGSGVRSGRYYGTSGTSSYLDLDSGAPYSLLASSEVNVTNSIICNDLEATETGGIVASNGSVFANRFYGNGNTTYYVDPNNSTTAAVLAGGLEIGYGSAGEYRIEIGEGRTGNGYAYIDLVGDTTYSDYGLRLIRNNSGANTSSQLVHRGTGNLEFKTWDAGDMIFSTANTERMQITSGGYVQATNSFRAPIFYDSNDTTYYVHPGDNSQLRNIYYNSWLRNNNSSSSGLYWETGTPGAGWHIYPLDQADMYIRAGSGNGSLRFTTGNETARGYVHWTTSNEVGFLNSGRNWSLRVDNSGNTFATSSHRAPIFYDSANSNFHWNPNTDNSHRFTTPSGYLDIGPKNTSWCHLYTDRNGFYFNKTTFQLSGNQVFHDGYHPNADTLTTARTIGGSSFNGSANIDVNYIKAGGNGPSAEDLNTVANSVSVGRLEYRGFNASSSNAPPTSDNANGVITVGQHSGNYNAQLAFSSNGNIYWRDNPSSSNGSWRKMWDDSNDGSGSGLDADLLDGVQGASFLRSDAADTWSGDISTTSTNGIRFGSSNQTDTNDGLIAAGRFASGLNIVGTQTAAGTGRQIRVWGDLITNGGQAFWHAGNDGSGSGLDADLLDGVQGSGYLRSDATDYFTGKLAAADTDIRRAGIYGIYDSYRIGHIWSMGTGYNIANNGADFGNLYGLAYKHTNNSTGGTMGGSHQMVWCNNGSPRGSIGYNSVWHTESMKAPIFYDSNNTAYYVDPGYTSFLKDVNVHGTFRFQRSATTETGQDDNVSVTVGDSDITFRHNNDDDGDASVYNFQYRSGGNDVNILNFASNYAEFNTPYVRCRNNSTDYAQLESNSSGGVLKAVSNGNANVLIRSYGDSYTLNDFGIGVASPDARLHVLTSGAAALIQSTQGLSLEVRGGANSGDIARFTSPDGTIKTIVNTNGYLGVNNTSPSYHIDVSGDIRASSKLRISTYGAFLSNYYSYVTTNSELWVGNGGGGYARCRASSFTVSSDYRLKENLENLENPIERLKELKVYRFNWKDKPDEDKVDGFIAHEVSDVVPDAVDGEKDGIGQGGEPDYQGIDHGKLVPLLTSALQEAILKIEQLETRIQTLENQ